MNQLASPRAAFRLARVGLHLVGGLVTVALVFPIAGAALRMRLKQRWSRQLLDRLGVAGELHGHPAGTGLIVANHVSWLDIFVINSVTPAVFVCKDEVRAWPLIGWLCRRTGTIFIARGNSRSAREVGAEMAQLLAAGGRVAVFPEGTTSDGSKVLPFRSALFQPAIDAGVVVQPILIRYRDDAGATCAAPVYVGDTTLFGSMWQIAVTPGIRVRVEALAVLDGRGSGRRGLAECAETRLREALPQVPRLARCGGAGRGSTADAGEPANLSADAAWRSGRMKRISR